MKTAVQNLAEKMRHPEVFNPFIEQALIEERKEIESAFAEGLLLPEESDLNGHKYFELTYNNPKQNG